MRVIQSLSGARLIYLKRDEIFKTLYLMAEELLKEISEVSALYLFGSLSKGQERGLSDIDLLVVVDESLSCRLNFWSLYWRVFNFVADRLELDFDLILVEREKAPPLIEKLGAKPLANRN